MAEGDSVALCLRNDFSFFEASFGVALVGACPVAVNWHLTAEEARYVFEDCDAKAIVIHADLVPRLREAFSEGVTILVVETPAEILEAYGLEEAVARVSDGMTSWACWRDSHAAMFCIMLPAPRPIIYTSGTTGRPKGVRFAPSTAAALETRVTVARRGFGFLGYQDRSERIVAILTGPLYHSSPNGYALQAVRMGATLVLQVRFDAEGLLRLIAQRRATHVHMVPVMFNRLLALSAAERVRHDLSSPEFVVYAAAPCLPAIKRAMIEWWGPIFHKYYGGTETGIVTSCNSAEWLTHRGTVGRPVTEATLRVIGAGRSDCVPGQPGEIICRILGMADFTCHRDPAKRQEIDHEGRQPGRHRLFQCGRLPLSMRPEPGHGYLRWGQRIPPRKSRPRLPRWRAWRTAPCSGFRARNSARCCPW